MAVSFKIKVESRRLESAFREAGARCRHMRPAWEEVGEILQRSIRRNFDDQGRPKKWPPLSQATLIKRAGGSRRAYKKRGGLTKRAKRIVGGAKALIDTGRLMNSLTRIATDRDVEAGTNTIYANTHQHGRGKIPARPFLLIQSEDEPKIVRAIEEYIGRPLL